jgi:hypothetical protein
MDMPINRIVFAVLAIGAVGSSLLAAPGSAQNQSASRTHPQGQGQGQGQNEGGNAQGAIDAATAKALNTAIEALNMEKYAEAQARQAEPVRAQQGRADHVQHLVRAREV